MRFPNKGVSIKCVIDLVLFLVSKLELSHYPFQWSLVKIGFSFRFQHRSMLHPDLPQISSARAAFTEVQSVACMCGHTCMSGFCIAGPSLPPRPRMAANPKIKLSLVLFLV